MLLCCVIVFCYCHYYLCCAIAVEEARSNTFNYLRIPNDSGHHSWAKGNVNVDSKYHTKPHYQCKLLDLYSHTTDGPTMWHCMAQQQLLTPAENTQGGGKHQITGGKDVAQAARKVAALNSVKYFADTVAVGTTNIWAAAVQLNSIDFI